MKHRQNRGRILLPEEVFCANGTQLITLTPDNSLIAEIQEKMKLNKEIQEVVNKLRRGVTRDSKIPLGLCQDDNGLLLYEGLIWVPNNDKLRLRIQHPHHDAQAAGHPGRAKTLELVSWNHYWPQIRQYVNRYVDHCDTCKRIKPIKHAPFGLLRPLQIPERPWESIYMDVITGLPEEEGSNTIWVIVDRLTKMAYFVACVDTMGQKELADGFLTHYHGVEQMLVPSMLMHIRCTYVAYVCLYPYVCLYLRMFAICLCTSVCAYGFLCLLMPLMHAYVYLSIWSWVMISMKEFSVGIRRMEEREVFGGNLVLYQERRIYVYKRTCPPTVLSFFLSSSCNVLYSLLNTSFSSPSLVQPRLSCPLPGLCFEIPSLAVTRPSCPVLLSPTASSLAPPCLAHHYTTLR
jgi:hypothetical protein